MTDGAGGNELALGGVAHRTMRKLEHARARLAEARASAAAEAGAARDLLRKLQDAQAANFRLGEELALARLEADESAGLRLDLEAQLHVEQQRYLELQSRTHQVGEQLRQVLATHAGDSEAWRSELERVHALAQRDSEAWRSELERVQALAERDNAVWQAEVARLRGLLDASTADRDAASARERAAAVETTALRSELLSLQTALAAARSPRAALRLLVSMVNPRNLLGRRRDAAAGGDVHGDGRADPRGE